MEHNLDNRRALSNAQDVSHPSPIIPSASLSLSSPLLRCRHKASSSMPKVSRVGKFRQTAAAETAPLDASKDVSQLSRGQRKRQAKKDQYLKRQKLVLSTLQLQHQEDQKSRIDGLDALKEALQATSDVSSPAATAEGSKLLSTNKSKKELTAREVSHLGLVMEHPAFQDNPFETIQQHLKNTLAGQAKELDQQSAIRTKQDAVAEEKRKKEKKELQRERGGKHRKKFKASRSRR